MRCVKMCQWYIEVHLLVLLFNNAALRLFNFCSIYTQISVNGLPLNGLPLNGLDKMSVTLFD